MDDKTTEIIAGVMSSIQLLARHAGVEEQMAESLKELLDSCSEEKKDRGDYVFMENLHKAMSRPRPI